MSKEPFLKVRDLKKIYPGDPPFVAVDGISFDLYPGEILGLLGPNGAGKTTTIQMLMSTLTYSSGQILYFGKDFTKHRSEILSHVVFASAYVSLPWRLSIKHNLEVFGRLYGLSGKEIKIRMDELLERFGILDKKNTLVAQLSAGQTTRLMLVKAFLVKPKILLLDEPTASLDPDVAHEVCDYLLEQRDKEGLSILFTSHKMSEVAELCDRVLFLQKGKIIANDTPKVLAQSAASSKLQLIILDGMKRTVAASEKMGLSCTVDHKTVEITLSENQIADFLQMIAASGVRYAQIRILQPTLEDYFMKMVGKK
jgi:ABC-2 type transport system ATP-binding protein